MKIRPLACSGLLLLLFTGCAVRQVKPPPEPDMRDLNVVKATTTIKYDQFRKATTYSGPGKEYNTPLLRAWKVAGQDMTYQIYTHAFYSSAWRFYGDAHDSDGNVMSFHLIGRDVDSCNSYRGCYYSEIVGLAVTRQYLDEHAQTGVRFKLSGSAGEEIYFMPPGYIKGFLAAIDM